MNSELLNQLIPALVVGVIGLIVGGIIGALLGAGSRSSGSGGDRSPGKNFSQVLQVWSDRRSGKLVVGLEGLFYDSSGKLNPRQRAAVLQAASELNTWVAPTDTASRLAAVTQPGAAGIKPAQSPAPNGNLPPIKPLPQPALSEAPAVKPPSLEMQDILANVLSPDPRAKAVEEENSKSIVAQVNEILQDILPRTPLSNRSIKLVEIPGRGMMVMLDGQGYEGVGDVPDVQVQQLIQYCVKEWEKRA